MTDDLISRKAAIGAIQRPYDEAKELWTMVQDVEIKVRMGQAVATYLEIVKMLNKLPPAQSAHTPCDLCVYDPPSSRDGKPCSMCPASAK